MDHDALFKWLLKDPVILRSFFEEFLPEVANYTDFSRLEYLDKETRTLRGVRRTGNLLVKVRFKGQEAAFLIHVEHEARKDRDIAWRLLEYVVLDQRESGSPVFPVIVLAYAAGPLPVRRTKVKNASRHPRNKIEAFVKRKATARNNSGKRRDNLLMIARKLFQKALDSPANLRFKDACILAKAFGFRISRVSGSHHILSHPRVRELLNLQSVHGDSKPYQVRQLLQLIKRYNLEPGDDE